MGSEPERLSPAHEHGLDTGESSEVEKIQLNHNNLDFTAAQNSRSCQSPSPFPRKQPKIQQPLPLYEPPTPFRLLGIRRSLLSPLIPPAPVPNLKRSRSDSHSSSTPPTRSQKLRQISEEDIAGRELPSVVEESPAVDHGRSTEAQIPGSGLPGEYTSNLDAEIAQRPQTPFYSDLRAGHPLNEPDTVSRLFQASLRSPRDTVGVSENTRPSPSREKEIALPTTQNLPHVVVNVSAHAQSSNGRYFESSSSRPGSLQHHSAPQLYQSAQSRPPYQHIPLTHPPSFHPSHDTHHLQSSNLDIDRQEIVTRDELGPVHCIPSIADPTPPSYPPTSQSQARAAHLGSILHPSSVARVSKWSSGPARRRYTTSDNPIDSLRPVPPPSRLLELSVEVPIKVEETHEERRDREIGLKRHWEIRGRERTQRVREEERRMARFEEMRAKERVYFDDVMNWNMVQLRDIEIWKKDKRLNPSLLRLADSIWQQRFSAEEHR